MGILEVATKKKKLVTIKLAGDEDFRVLTKKRYSFIWKSFKSSTTVYKLQLPGDDDILGVMALVDVPDEKRIEIKLLASSLENIGKGKEYDGIAGCLIAFACQLALSRYGNETCVSLVPKTELTDHYMTKYYMTHGGRQLYVDGTELLKIINDYGL